MSYIIDHLDKYEDYASRILGRLPDESEIAPGQDTYCDIRQLVQATRRAALRTKRLTASPLVIGFVGGIKTGKTELICTLIGRPNLLPSKPVPCTGNIAAVRLILSDEPELDPVSRLNISYLTKRDLNQCLAYMLEKLHEQARKISLDSHLLGELKNFHAHTNRGAIREWCMRSWQSSNDTRLRFMLREVVNFLVVCDAYADVMCGDESLVFREVPIEHKEVSLVLEHVSPQAIAEAPLEQLVREVKRADVRPATLTSELIRETFPLIKRVDVEVEVPRAVWQLPNMSRPDGIVILDFPGLGNISSSSRDEFLCWQELKQVHTIMLLLNLLAPDEAASSAMEIHDNLKKELADNLLNERIIVGINRFDTLALGPFAQTQDTSIIDALIRSAQPRGDGVMRGIEESEIFERLEKLRNAWEHARNFTASSSQIVLLSPLWMAVKQASKSSFLVEFAKRINSEDAAWLSKFADKWESVNNLLSDRSRTSAFAKALKQYIDDGGLSYLIALIAEQCRSHGLSRIFEVSRKSCQELRNHQKEICAWVTKNSLAPQGGKVEELRAALEHLANFYSGEVARLQQLGAAILPQSDGYADGKQLIFDRELIDELTTEVFNWNQWTELLALTKKGMIARQPSQNRQPLFRAMHSPPFRLPRPASLTKIKIPEKSGDFFPPFEFTLKQFLNAVRARISNLITTYFENVFSSAEFNRNRDILDVKFGVFIDSVGQAVTSSFATGEDNDRFNSLRLSLQPEWQKQYIEKDVLSLIDLSPTQAFPLLLGESSQYYGWSQKASVAADVPANHLAQILYIRQEIIKHSRRQIEAMLVGAQTTLQEYLQHNCLTNESTLRECLEPQNQGFLSGIARASSDSEVESLINSEWFKALEAACQSIGDPLA